MDPVADKEFERKLKRYDPNLFVEWDQVKHLWMVKRTDQNGEIHHIMYVQNPDGSFRPLDERTMQDLYECDIWRKFKDAGEYHRFIQDKNATAKLKEKNLREEYLKWWNKDHKSEWKEAVENAKSGILERPEQCPEPKIYV